MEKHVNTNDHDMPSVRISPQITIVSSTLFVVLLGLLHLLEPEFDPKWRLISEYELGNYGWLMRIAFFSLAIGCINLFIAIRSQIRGIGGTIGIVLLLIIAAGLTIGGIFTTDPITTSPDAHTFNGSLHGLGGGLSFPFIPFAALLITLNLIKHNQLQETARLTLLWSTGLVWFCFLSFIVIAIIQYQPVASPELRWGWSNRGVMVTYCIWLTATARYAKVVDVNKLN